jgi:hypothetical protein
MTAPAITRVTLFRNTVNDIGTATSFDITSAFLASVTPTNDGTTITYAGASIDRTGLSGNTTYYYWMEIEDCCSNVTDQYLGTITTAAPPLQPDISAAVDFDGTDYLSGTGTAVHNSKVGLGSFWFKTTSTGVHPFSTGTTSPFVEFAIILNSGVLRISATNTLDLWTVNSFTDGVWHHCLCSWDAANDVGVVYVDDELQPLSGSTVSDNNAVWDESRYTVGRRYSAVTNTLDGCMAELYVTREYLDLSVEANRRKFISAAGTPVSLGADGSLPTGNQPDIYLSGQAGNWNAGKNFGSGGDFTVTGTLTDCASSPGISSQVIPAWADLNTTNVGSITGGFGNLNGASGERRYDDDVYNEVVDVTIQATLPDDCYVSRLEPQVTHTAASSFDQLVEFKFYNSSNQLVYSSSSSLNSSGMGTLVGSVYNVNKVVKRMTVRSRRKFVVTFQKMLLFGFQQ